MNNRILLLLVFMTAASPTIFAQKETSKLLKPQTTVTSLPSKGKDPTKETDFVVPQIEENDHPYGGTFQIICSLEGGVKEIFTTDLLDLIEQKRLEDKEEILVLSKNTKVRILSKSYILSPSFQPIKNLYSFE